MLFIDKIKHLNRWEKNFFHETKRNKKSILNFFNIFIEKINIKLIKKTKKE